MGRGWEIVAADSAQALVHSSWIEMIQFRPELEPCPSVRRPNPFKPGEVMEIRPPETSAQLINEDEVIATISWALDESPALIVDIEDQDDEDSVLNILREIAGQMNAKLVETRW